MTNLAGLLDYVTTQANYRVSANGKTAERCWRRERCCTRDFKNNEFEYYVQDSWRIRPNLTINFGLRHTLLQTPYEVNGQQVSAHHRSLPVVPDSRDAGRPGQQRAARTFPLRRRDRRAGCSPTGRCRRTTSRPRLSFAYSPNVGQGFWRKIFGNGGDSVIRAGYGIYYDHFGESIVNLFDQYGSFGLSDSITNPTNVLTPDTSPRFTGLHNIPNLTGTPEQSDQLSGAVPDRSADQRLRHHARHRQPDEDTVRACGERLLAAAASRRVRAGGGLSRALQPPHAAADRSGAAAEPGRSEVGAGLFLRCYAALEATAMPARPMCPAIPYFENMFPDAAGGGMSATQNIYNDTLALHPGQRDRRALRARHPVLSGMRRQDRTLLADAVRQPVQLGIDRATATTTAARWLCATPCASGFQMEFSYTYSKSMDMGSDDERTVYSSSTGTSVGSSFSAILNAWNPRLSYAPSDFDVRHLITASWVADLPFGRGKLMGAPV